MKSTKMPALFITSPVFSSAACGSNHPLAISRHSTVVSLCKIFGWLPPSVMRIAKAASTQTLQEFHDPDYIAAFQQVCESGKVSAHIRQKYQLGTMENPIFTGLFERAATTVGGSILAAKLAIKGHVVYHPAGGTHHGRADKASGFCYFNDPVFAIGALLAGGKNRVAYIDLDAHHGDGVEDAFLADSRVLTVSIHEENRWPYSGALEDTGSDDTTCNLPVPKGINDTELGFLMQKIVLPLLHEFGPEAVVITCGADALAKDPLSGMQLSNIALWKAVKQLVELVPGAIVLGGGGYNPWTVARCWAGLWGVLSQQTLPGTLPPSARHLLGELQCDLIDEDEIEPQWLTHLQDQPNEGLVREYFKQLCKHNNSPNNQVLT